MMSVLIGMRTKSRSGHYHYARRCLDPRRQAGDKPLPALVMKIFAKLVNMWVHFMYTSQNLDTDRQEAHWSGRVRVQDPALTRSISDLL